MKICHIITELELGGAQLNVLETLKYFAEKGHDVILITNQRGMLNNEIIKEKNIKKYFLKDLSREINFKKDRKAKKEMIEILRKEKPHIVHTHSSKAGILGRLAAKKAKIPCIIHTVHGYGFHFFKSKIFKKIAISLEKKAAKYTNKLIFVSKDDMEISKELKIGSKDKYEIIRSGVDFDYFKNYKGNRTNIRRSFNIPSKRKIIVNVAPFKRQKNLMGFLRIIYELSKTHADKFFAIIVGDGKYRAKMENFINKHELNEHVLLTGFLKDIRDILYVSDIYLSTSLWEGLPRSILEALLMNTYVVAPAIGGVREVIKNDENGFLYDSNNEEEALSILKTILNSNNDTLNRHKHNSPDSLSHEFTLSNMLLGLEKIYNDC